MINIYPFSSFASFNLGGKSSHDSLLSSASWEEAAALDRILGNAHRNKLDIPDDLDTRNCSVEFA